MPETFAHVKVRQNAQIKASILLIFKPSFKKAHTVFPLRLIGERPHVAFLAARTSPFMIKIWSRRRNFFE